jgi:hypothetical protein
MMNNFEIKKILGGEAKDNSWDSTYIVCVPIKKLHVKLRPTNKGNRLKLRKKVIATLTVLPLVLVYSISDL